MEYLLYSSILLYHISRQLSRGIPLFVLCSGIVCETCRAVVGLFAFMWVSNLIQREKPVQTLYEAHRTPLYFCSAS